MPWFYAEEGKQVGPVDDIDFERLVAAGSIAPGTLVWREGMPNWEPLAKLRPAPPPPMALPQQAPVAPGQVRCTECQKVFPVEETVEIGAARVCAACKPLFVQKLREGTARLTQAAASGGSFRYAGFWIRVVAKIIDSLIVGIPMMIIYFVSAFALGVNAVTGPGGQAAFGALLGSLAVQLLAQAVGLVLGGFYTVYFVVKYGATPGKMAVNLRVVTPDGARLSIGRAIGRYFAEMVSAMACYVGYILVAFDDEKRSLHDRICETRVVYK